MHQSIVFLYCVYDVVVKKVHVRYLISCRVSGPKFSDDLSSSFLSSIRHWRNRPVLTTLSVKSTNQYAHFKLQTVANKAYKVDKYKNFNGKVDSFVVKNW